MTRRLAWTADAWSDYVYWQSQDRKTLKRINSLIAQSQRTPFAGLGKPEPLRENISRFRSLGIVGTDLSVSSGRWAGMSASVPIRNLKSKQLGMLKSQRKPV